MVLNIITLAACVVLILIFRRLDRSNLKLIKLKRYSDKIQKDFKKLTENEGRRLDDATIEMDILLKKAAAVSVGLKESIIDIEGKLKGLSIEKSNLKKVEEDLRVVSQAARDVNQQIEFISATRESFSEVTKRIGVLNENIANLDSSTAAIIESFNNKVRERSRELTAEISLQTGKLKESTRDIEERLRDFALILEDTRDKNAAETRAEIEQMGIKIQNLNAIFSDLENTAFSEVKNFSDRLKKDIQATYDKLDADIERAYGRLKSVEANIDDSKAKLITTFEEEVNKIRTELDNLSIHAISKKDDIVKAARAEAEEIKTKIDDFSGKYNELETKLVATAEDKMGRLIDEYRSIETRFESLSDKLTAFEEQFGLSLNSQMDKTKTEFAAMEKRLADIRAEILDYEEKQKVFSRTDQLIDKVDKSVEQFNRVIKDSKEEARNLERFIGDLGKLKEIRKEVEREIKIFQARREKVASFEGEIKTLLDTTDFVTHKVQSLEERMGSIDQVNGRIDALARTHASEARINELQEYETSIAKNLESVHKADLLIQAIDGQIKSFQKTMDRGDKRIDKMNQYLQSIEEKTLILKTKEQEIRDVKDKFTELDSLSEHMEKRIDQINAMFQKIESMRSDVDETDSRLKTMFTETDRKMRQLADFLHAVESAGPIAKQMKGELPIDKSINEGMVRTVRELSRKGWSSNEIAKKLLIDENSIRFIINTTSM